MRAYDVPKSPSRSLPKAIANTIAGIRRTAIATTPVRAAPLSLPAAFDPSAKSAIATAADTMKKKMPSRQVVEKKALSRFESSIETKIGSR